MNTSIATWYDEHYYKNAHSFGPWHRFLLPDLVNELKANADIKLLELGCGQADVLRQIVKDGLITEKNVFGVDQSQEAIKFSKRFLPSANLFVQDIYETDFPPNTIQICLLLETIEHLEQPQVVLKKIFTVMNSGGILYLSFPNYLHLPWLAVRILAEKLNHPNWIVLQPIDKIYTVFGIIKMLEKAGFIFEKGIGSNYGPPVFYPMETDKLTRLLNRWHMWWWSFHPILKFRKPLPVRI